MSLWKIGADDVSEETQQFKDKLASKDGQIAHQQAKLTKQAQEMDELKASLTETMQKLAAETERGLQLQQDLKQYKEDLRNEKNTSRNIEASLQSANDKLKSKEKEIRELESHLEHMSGASDDNQARYRKLEQDKQMLEIRTHELESQLRHAESANEAASRRRPSRHSSSQFHDLKIQRLERELKDMREKLEEKDLEMSRVQAKCTKAQEDLLRVDNERLAQEAKSKFQLDELRALLHERDEELEFSKAQQGDGGREAELMQRIEEDEAKMAAYESMLNELDDVKGLKEELKRAERRWKAEAEKVVSLEAQNVDLLKEREGTLDQLDIVRGRIHELELDIREKQEQIDNTRLERSQLASAIDEAKNTLHPQDAPLQNAATEEVNVLHVARLLNAITRLRGERDDLNRRLEFLDIEHRFTVEALEERVSSEHLSPHQMQSGLVPALAILLSHSQDELEHCHNLISESARREQQHRERAEADTDKYLAMEAEADRLVSQARGSDERARRLEISLETTMSQLENITAQRDDLLSQLDMHEEEAKSTHKEMRDRLEEVDLQLCEASKTLEVVESERDSLALEVTNLTADLKVAQDELSNAESRYSDLQFNQLSNMTSSEVTRTLREQIKELDDRVLRRTEQIGIHQHDIRRLETNLRLQEERLTEMTIELETMATQKETMLEDCADAREARDEALAQIEGLEDDVESLEKKLAESDRALHTMICLLVQLSAQSHSLAQSSQARTAYLEEQVAESKMARTVLEEELSDIRSAVSEDTRHAIIAFASSQLRLKKLSAFAQSLLDQKLQNDTLMNELALAKERISQQDFATRQLEEECAALRQGSSSSLAELAAQSSEYQAEINELKRVVSDTKTENKRQREEFVQSSEELEKMRREKADLIAGQEHTRSQLTNQYQSETERLREELVALATSLDEERANWATSEKDYEDALSQAQGQIDSLQKQRESINEEFSQLSVAWANLQGERDEMQRKLNAMQEEAAGLLRQKESSERAHDDLAKANRQLSEALSQLREEQTSLVQNSLVQNDHLRQELESTNARLEAKISEMTSAIEVRTQEVERLSRELGVAKASLKENEKISAQGADSRELAQSRIRDLEHELDELRKHIQQNDSSLRKAGEENDRLQEHITTLEAQVQKYLSYANAMEREVQDGQRAVETLKKDLVNAQADLSKAETTAKTTEMKISLQTAQYKRELSKLQDKLAALESQRHLKDALASLEERNNDMEELLKAKCAEIEENDDRALEMLKENKKLSGKVEALSRKVQNLQTKLNAAKAAAAESKAATAGAVAEASLAPPVQKSSQKSSPKIPATDLPEQTSRRRRSSRSSTGTSVSFPAQGLLNPTPNPTSNTSVSRMTSNPSSSSLRPKTPEKRLVPAPVYKLRTPEQPPSQIQTMEPPTSVAGVKRRAPDDFEAPSGPPQGFTADSIPSRENDSTTPRARRMFGNLQSGFTPIRNKVLSSPKRQSAGLSTPLIQDVTNSPRSSVPLDSAAKQKRSWLGKIRGNTAPTGGKQASRQVFTYMGESYRS